MEGYGVPQKAFPAQNDAEKIKLRIAAIDMESCFKNVNRLNKKTTSRRLLVRISVTDINVHKQNRNKDYE